MATSTRRWVRRVASLLGKERAQAHDRHAETGDVSVQGCFQPLINHVLGVVGAQDRCCMTGTMQIQQQLAAAILRVPERVLHVFVLKRVFNCCGPLSGLQECCGGAGLQKSAGSFAGAKQEQSEGAREFFFARVPPTVTSDELLAVFSKYGVVENLNLFK